MKPGVRRRVMLAMANTQRLRQVGDLLMELDVDVVGACQDGQTGIALLSRTLTDVFLCDMVLPMLDGPALVKRVRGLSLHTMPVVVLMVATPMPAFERQALSDGVHSVIVRPFAPGQLKQLLDSLTVDDRIERDNAQRQHILEALRRLGFSMKLRGTGYLVEAISIVSRDVRYVEDLTTSLYPMVAERFSVEPDKVEHAMRRAVESAWSSGALESQHKAFGNTIDARRGKPTSGEMIARISELLRVKEI